MVLLAKLEKNVLVVNQKKIRRLRRVSGYLAEVDRFAEGKRKELDMRVGVFDTIK